ncbi:uncharacterized protein PG986_006460 [Apiospora aurea]|uniref:Uncharacterized protein n=1 Tax=Apiospora aurea TaxID=335848 RepID=A0ABR1QKU3_9PEZI
MGLADTIRETFGGGAAATHEGQTSSEASRGVVDVEHTPGAFPETPAAEDQQRELGGSQLNPTPSSILPGKEGARGHEHKDSGVGLSDVTGSHPKTVGQTDPLHSGTTGDSKLVDVTNSRPQTVDKSALSHNTSAAANTPVSTGLSDVTQSRPQTVEKGALRQAPAQTLETGTLQSHPRTTVGHDDAPATTTTGGHHFRRSSVDMPKDSSSTGPSEGIDSHHKKDPSTLGGLLGGNYLGGASHKHEVSPLDKDSHMTGDTAGGLFSSEPYNRNTATTGTTHRSALGNDTNSTASALGGTDASHNTVSQGKDKSSTGNEESYWGNLPTAASLPSAGSIYNTVTGSGSGEDHSVQHRRVPAAGDDEVAMHSASHSPDSHVPRGGIYNTVVGHGSSADDTVAGRTPEHNRSGSGSIYNTLSGAAAGGYNAAANAAQELYNTVSGRSGSGTEHGYEHEKPLTTTASTSNTAGAEHESPFSTTSPSTTSRAVNPNTTTSSSTGNNQGVAAGAYNTLASAAQGVSDAVTGNNNTSTTGTHQDCSTPLTGTTTTGSHNTTSGSYEPGIATGAYNAVANTAQSVSDTVTGNNRTTGTTGYEQGGPYDSSSTSSGLTGATGNTSTTGNQGVAAGAYNAVANAAQSAADTVTGRNTSGTEHQSGHNTGSATGTHRTFPLDNSPTFTTTDRSVGSDRNPAAAAATTHDHHDHHKTGQHLAGAGAGAVAGKGAYDFLHRKGNDKTDARNEFHSDSAGLFSDSELKNLSLRQKDGSHADDVLAAPSHGEQTLSTSGPGQSHGFHGMSSHPTSSGSGTDSGVGYDTPASLAAAGSRSQQARGDDFHGTGQTHGLGSGHPSAHKSEIPIPSRAHESQTHGLGSGHPSAHKSEIPMPSRVHENTSPSSLADQRAEPPRSSAHHSGAGAGLAGAGLGAGAGYGASRLARDHHDDKHASAAAGEIPSSTSPSRQHQPFESSTLNRLAEPASSDHHHKEHKDKSSTGHHSVLPFPTRKHHDKHADETTTASDSLHDQHHHDKDSHEHGHKARDVATFGAGAAAAGGAYETLRDDKTTGHRQPGQTAAAANTGSSPATMSSIANERRHAPLTSTTAPTSTTSPTSALDTHQKERAAAGMTGISPSSAGLGAGAGAAAAAASGTNQQGTLSRAGGDGHAPLHSTHDEHMQERGTTVPAADGKKDPYNHLSSGTPSGVSLE